MDTTHFLIAGKRWKLSFVTARDLPRGTVGLCDPPDTVGKTIRILKGQTPRDELDTIIHEVLHASMWDVCEEKVLEFASDLERILTRLGYKRELNATEKAK